MEGTLSAAIPGELPWTDTFLGNLPCFLVCEMCSLVILSFLFVDEVLELCSHKIEMHSGVCFDFDYHPSGHRF